MNQTLALLTTSTILSLQIFTLQPASFSVPQNSYGSTYDTSKKNDAPKFSHRLQEATFVAKNHQSEFSSVIFTGDVMMARNVEVLMNRNGVSYPFEKIDLKDLADKPAIVGNFESAMLQDHIPTPAHSLRFATMEENLAGLKEAEFTHLSLSNNHSLDYGVLGYLYTQTALNDSGLSSFGYEREVAYETTSFLETPMGTVALVGFNDSDLSLDIEAAKSELKRVSEKSDLQFVYIHWGEEYKIKHSARQEYVATELVAAGSDLIVGHHPHVVQDVDVIGGVPVFYSLGNYVFDQYFERNVQEGLVLVLTFDPVARLELIPVSSIGSLSQPKLVRGDDKAEFLYNLSSRSDESIQPDMQRGFVSLFGQVASSPKIAMIDS